MRHRKNQASKITYKHHKIEGLLEFLEQKLEPIEDITSIIVGRIERSKGAITKNLQVKVRMKTLTGFKLIARSKDAVQEVFVVTNSKELWKEGQEL